ncbi:glutamate receptor 3,4 [Ceratobasidium sp. AG-Ba]|nr:glutamate receptor 3,4 [Ceratobasidium sp. AG-Ba]QRW03994.1 glutamate receptor 3,4 [Ceratobasidium sp. AG-Ba]
MHKCFASSESDSESIGDEFVEKVRQGFKCTICSNVSSKAVVFASPSRILAHTTTRIHIDRAEHYNFSLADRKPAQLSDAGTLRLDPNQSETALLPQTPVSEASIDFPPNMNAPEYPSSPSSPALPETSRIIPDYDYFQDLVYEDLVGEGDILGEEQSIAESRTGVLCDDSLPSDFGHTQHSTREPLPAETMWSPYTDEPHFLTYSLFHTAHVRFSQHQQEAILDWARAMGTPSVPTLSHIFHVNRLDSMLQQDMSNPNTRQKMEFYPRNNDGHVSEFWDGQKLSQGENCSQLTPMAVCGNRIYYVGEVSPANVRDHFSKAFSLALNPLLEVARDRPIYSAPYVVFVDDVSGNVSKQWNEHWCCYVSNTCLPRDEMSKRFNIRSMSTTQHASPLEMLAGIQEEFSDTFQNMVVAWDVLENREVLIRPYIYVILGDNPMQALECSSLGLKAGKFCRTCDVGGTNKFKVSNEGFEQIFKARNIVMHWFM